MADVIGEASRMGMLIAGLRGSAGVHWDRARAKMEILIKTWPEWKLFSRMISSVYSFVPLSSPRGPKLGIFPSSFLPGFEGHRST